MYTARGRRPVPVVFDGGYVNEQVNSRSVSVHDGDDVAADMTQRTAKERELVRPLPGSIVVVRHGEIVERVQPLSVLEHAQARRKRPATRVQHVGVRGEALLGRVLRVPVLVAFRQVRPLWEEDQGVGHPEAEEVAAQRLHPAQVPNTVL